ncbi:hypothetical protein OCU04_004366 [Sclerotinia nivalis]|uniref:Uncharacterized protein n=1 Tax=Sclerotinia nivalis TaxID=352851 RepID=A0A9X0AQA9_9HELO|nr:hypothetical protein OCU04_004366 [Sclerotinia nivalis]
MLVYSPAIISVVKVEPYGSAFGISLSSPLLVSATFTSHTRPVTRDDLSIFCHCRLVVTDHGDDDGVYILDSFVNVLSSYHIPYHHTLMPREDVLNSTMTVASCYAITTFLHMLSRGSIRHKEENLAPDKTSK